MKKVLKRGKNTSTHYLNWKNNLLRVYFSHFIAKHDTIVKDIFHRLGTQFCTVYCPVIGQDFFIKCDQIRRKLRIWSHLLKKSLMENFVFCAVSVKRGTIKSIYRIGLIARIKFRNWLNNCLIILKFLDHWGKVWANNDTKT